jgi:hypothetical protein
VDVDTHVRENPFVAELEPQAGWNEYLRRNEQLGIAAVKAKMPLFLEHFVSCWWGACYHTMFATAIAPHLDNPEILDLFLCSGAVQDRGNSITAQNGARMYYDLFQYLMNVKSDAVTAYLRKQFPQYAARFDVLPFVFTLGGK